MLRVILFVVILGLAVYLLIRLVQRRGDGGGGRGFGRRPVAPDDDPTFLRDLDTQLWEQQQRDRQQQEQDEPPPA
jgi:hypothetical protein